jgi:hypothetical protein
VYFCISLLRRKTASSYAYFVDNLVMHSMNWRCISDLRMLMLSLLGSVITS